MPPKGRGKPNKNARTVSSPLGTGRGAGGYAGGRGRSQNSGRGRQKAAPRVAEVPTEMTEDAAQEIRKRVIVRASEAQVALENPASCIGQGTKAPGQSNSVTADWISLHSAFVVARDFALSCGAQSDALR